MKFTKITCMAFLFACGFAQSHPGDWIVHLPQGEDLKEFLEHVRTHPQGGTSQEITYDTGILFRFHMVRKRCNNKI